MKNQPTTTNSRTSVFCHTVTTGKKGDPPATLDLGAAVKAVSYVAMPAVLAVIVWGNIHPAICNALFWGSFIFWASAIVTDVLKDIR